MRGPSRRRSFSVAGMVEYNENCSDGVLCNSTHILLGISGSIAAYKTPELVRLFKQKGWSVRTIATDSALRFVSPLSLETVSEAPVLMPSTYFSGTIPHLTQDRHASVFVLAPATANIIAKCAHGIADDPVSSSFLAFTGVKVIVPAMHTEMWVNPITQANVARLRELGVMVFGPASGELSCGDRGVGRMIDLALIVHGVEAIISGQTRLALKRVLITVGGTRESIDNMRVLTNLSTGKLGWYLAHTAALFGAKVGVISTVPTSMDNPHLEFVDRVNSVSEMQAALHHHILNTDTLIMAAAVSDFTVVRQDSKIKREGDTALKLIKTPDLLKSLEPVKGHRQFIGFCLEDEELLVSAKRKLQAKNLDYIVANSSQAVGADTRSVYILSRITDGVVSLEDAGLSDITKTLLALIF